MTERDINARTKPELAQAFRQQQAEIILKYFPRAGVITREEINAALRRES